MRTLFMLVIIFTLVFLYGIIRPSYSQVKIDSSYAEYLGNSVYLMHGYVTFQQPISIGDYRIGFRFSQNKDQNYYAPMGDYILSAGDRKLQYWTEIVNPPLGFKFFYEPAIIPIAEQKKFEVTNIVGRLINLYAEPLIDSNLPSITKVRLDENAHFDIYATGENLEYEWFYKTMNTDSIYNTADSTWAYWFTWNEPTKISSATSSSYITNKVKLSWNGRKYFVRVYNNIGEEISKQSKLKVQ